MGLSRLVAVPDLFRRLPREAQNRLAYRSIRPAGAAWLPPRLKEVPIRLGRTVVSATPRDGHCRSPSLTATPKTVDHLLYGTGYQVDITRYSFLTPGLTGQSDGGGYPLLDRGTESSVPGLHFLGAPAAWSFGPIVRFVSGRWYTSRALVRAIAGPSRLRPASAQRPFQRERDRAHHRQGRHEPRGGLAGTCPAATLAES